MSGRAESAAQRPSYSQNWQRSSLCGCGAQPNPFTQLKPLNARTSTQNVSESPAAKSVCAASGADLVCRRVGWGGALKLHIILAFIIFSCRAKARTLSLFVSVCLLRPPGPPRRPRASCLSAEHSRLRASTFAEEYHCVGSSGFILRLSLWFCFFARRGCWLWEDVCHLRRKTFPLSSHGSFCRSDVRCEISLARQNAQLRPRALSLASRASCS